MFARRYRYYIGTKMRLFLGALAIILLLILNIFILYLSHNNNVVYQLFYSETSNLDYKVCLRENEYFQEHCLDKDRQYITNIIDYIETSFEYNLTASNFFNYNYNYYITAKIIANEKNQPQKILFNKEEIILPKKSNKETNSQMLLIKENIKIDYSKYNALMTSFRKDYSLTLDGRLVITMHIDLKGKYENIDESIITNQAISLTIPLSEQTLDIKMDYQDINNSKLIKEESDKNFQNIIYYILNAAFIIITIYIVYKYVKFIFKITNTKSIYDKKLNKILKEYNQIIVSTKKTINLNQTIIDINSFEELLDVRETINKPILYMKVHNQKSIFIISSGKECYRFILKAVDLESTNL